jgi:hypothetical protein
MPEILRGRSPLEDFPQHVHALGMAVVELAALEITCVHLLAALLQTTEAVADAILMSSTSTRARIDIIKSVVLAELSEGISVPIRLTQTPPPGLASAIMAVMDIHQRDDLAFPQSLPDSR